MSFTPIGPRGRTEGTSGARHPSKAEPTTGKKGLFGNRKIEKKSGNEPTSKTSFQKFKESIGLRQNPPKTPASSITPSSTPKSLPSGQARLIGQTLGNSQGNPLSALNDKKMQLEEELESLYTTGTKDMASILAKENRIQAELGKVKKAIATERKGQLEEELDALHMNATKNVAATEARINLIRGQLDKLNTELAHLQTPPPSDSV